MSPELPKAFIIIALLGLALYSFSLANSFLWDDISLVQENRFIKNLDNWHLSFNRLLFHNVPGRSKFYRPIQEISYALDYRLWGLNPFGFHLTSIFVHISCAFLLSAVLYQIFKNFFISFWGGAFFVVHPVHTEAVAYIAGRADPLALFFILLSLSIYIQATRRNKALLTVSLFSFLLALFSRESSLVFPFVILTYNFVFLKETSLKDKLFPFFLFMLTAGIYLSVRFRFAALDSLKLYQWNQPWQIRCLTQLEVASRYLLLLLFPHKLHMERFVPWSKSILDLPILSSLLFIGLTVYLCVKLSKQEKSIIFFSLFFIITLFPFLNIIPLNAQLASHWLYLPSIGFFAILSWGAFRINGWLMRFNLGKDVLPLMLTFFLLVYASITIKQIYTWKDPLTFYTYTARQAPYSKRIRLGLALAYLKEKRYEEAASLLTIIAKTSSEDLKARNNLAVALIELGKLKEAQRNLEIILKMDPEYIEAYLTLAKLYLKKDEEKKAIDTYYKAIAVKPDFIYSYYELGNLYCKGGKIKKAKDIFLKGLAVNDEFPELHNNLGICYAELDRLDEAEKEWEKALSLDPYYQEAKYNLEKLKK